MEMREFGGVGMRASVIGLGCNNFGIYQDPGRRLQLCVRRWMSESISWT
jgi:aryl-alcohol dehydrogenase-like predicted oxidoreductase